MRALATPVRHGAATTSSTRPGTGGGRHDVQRLDDRRADRRRRRLRGRQARQPLGDRPVRLGRRARGARRAASTSRPRVSRAASTRPASASCSRPPTTRRRATSCPVRKELGGAHDLQPARPADQSGGRATPARRRRRPGLRSTSLAGALARLGSRQGAGSVQRRRPGRAEHVRPDPRGRGRGRAAERGTSSSPRTSGSPSHLRRAVAGGTPEDNAATCARSSPASPVRARDLALLNAGAAIYAGGARRLDRRRRRAPRDAAIDDGAAAGGARAPTWR